MIRLSVGDAADGHAVAIPSTFGGCSAPGVVDQDAADELRGRSEEVGPVVPGQRVLSHELQERFVDEGSRLEGVVVPLATEMGPGQGAELVIHRREQLLELGLMARGDPLQDPVSLHYRAGRHRSWVPHVTAWPADRPSGTIIATGLPAPGL